MVIKMKIKKEDVIDTLKNGGKMISTLALTIYGEGLNQAGKEAFSDAIELGLENSFASLYDAKVNDKEIIRVVCEHWGISTQEAEERLVFEKQNAAIRSLKQYLKLQNYSQHDIETFFYENRASIKIRKEKELWTLKDSPEKLYKAVTIKKSR